MVVVHALLSFRGGAETVTRALVEAWTEGGHQVIVLSYDDLPSVHPRLRRPLFPWFVAWWLLGSRSAKDIDVIDSATGDCWVYARLTAGGRSPLLVTRSHGLEQLGEQAHQRALQRSSVRAGLLRQVYFAHWMLWEVRQSLRGSDLVRVLSRREAEFCATNLGIQSSKILVGPNGFAESLLRPALLPSAGVLRLAAIGRWEPLKGARELGCVVTETLRRLPTATVSLLGTGNGAKDVLADIGEDVHDRVHVVPSYASSGVGEQLSDHHVYVSMSHVEGFSVALVEAMAAGLVPAVTAVGAAPDLIEEGVNGRLLPVGDVRAAVAAIVELAEDSKLLDARRLAARESVAALTWREVAGSTLRSYLSAARDTPRVRTRRLPWL